MDQSEPITRRYLLKELSESEQFAFEEKYFTDSQAFEQVLKTESELVDGYVRGRLSEQARLRFEQSYMAHPRGRERVKFAEALATRLDQEDTTVTDREPAVMVVSRWQKLLASLRGQKPMLRFSLALAILLMVVGGIWLLRETRRLRLELAQAEAARADQASRERELQQQLADEQMRAGKLAGEETRASELAAELERLRAEQQSAQTKSSSPLHPEPAFVTLSLAVGGVRGAETESPTTLNITSGTEQVQIRLNLKEHDYASYGVVLRAVGGREIFNRQGLKPKSMARGGQLVLTITARKFASGDYMLTLSGINQEGEIDALSKSIFRVEKR